MSELANDQSLDEKALHVYLNDHLAGATFGADLARQLGGQAEGTPFQPEMSRLAAEIEADLDTLRDLMQRIGATRNPGKQVAGWIAEKASHLKLTGLTAGHDQLGTFLSLEALSLGVEGKASLWTALLQLRDEHPELQSTDLERLLQRARQQRDILEAERITAAKRALTPPAENDA